MREKFILISMKTPLYFLLLVVCTASFAQEEKAKRLRVYQKRFQFSLFPGVSTNGVGSAFYFNKYGLNLFGGLSAGSKVIEIGAITNSHFQSSTGIQLAGLANIGGTNAFINL